MKKNINKKLLDLVSSPQTFDPADYLDDEGTDKSAENPEDPNSVAAQIRAGQKESAIENPGKSPVSGTTINNSELDDQENEPDSDTLMKMRRLKNGESLDEESSEETDDEPQEELESASSLRNKKLKKEAISMVNKKYLGRS